MYSKPLEEMLSISVHRFIRVSNVQEEVLFVVFLVQRSHGGRGGGDHIVHEEEESVFWSQAYPLLRGVPGTAIPWWQRWGGSHCSRRRRERLLVSGLSSSSWCSWYSDPMVAEVGGITLFTKKKRASSGL